MDIPLQLILFSIPALIYLVLLKKRGDDWTEALRKIGWRGSRLVYYFWSIGICSLIGGFGWLTLGDWLVRRFGFQSGNLIQALAFLLPHLILFAISLSLLPIVIVQFIAGLLMGWLRHRSESILPGWLAHSLVNALGALSILE